MSWDDSIYSKERLDEYERIHNFNAPHVNRYMSSKEGGKKCKKNAQEKREPSGKILKRGRCCQINTDWPFRSESGRRNASRTVRRAKHQG